MRTEKYTSGFSTFRYSRYVFDDVMPSTPGGAQGSEAPKVEGEAVKTPLDLFRQVGNVLKGTIAEIGKSLIEFTKDDKEKFKDAFGVEMTDEALKAMKAEELRKGIEKKPDILNALFTKAQKEGSPVFNSRGNADVEENIGLRDLVGKNVEKITLYIHPKNLQKGGNKAIYDKSPEAQEAYAAYEKDPNNVTYFTRESTERKENGDFSNGDGYIRIYSGDYWKAPKVAKNEPEAPAATVVDAAAVVAGTAEVVAGALPAIAPTVVPAPVDTAVAVAPIAEAKASTPTTAPETSEAKGQDNLPEKNEEDLQKIINVFNGMRRLLADQIMPGLGNREIGPYKRGAGLNTKQEYYRVEKMIKGISDFKLGQAYGKLDFNTQLILKSMQLNVGLKNSKIERDKNGHYSYTVDVSSGDITGDLEKMAQNFRAMVTEKINSLSKSGFKNVNFWADELKDKNYDFVELNDKFNDIDEGIEDVVSDIKEYKPAQYSAIGNIGIRLNPSGHSAAIHDGYHQDAKAIGIDYSKGKEEVKRCILKGLEEYIAANPIEGVAEASDKLSVADGIISFEHGTTKTKRTLENTTGEQTLIKSGRKNIPGTGNVVILSFQKTENEPVKDFLYIDLDGNLQQMEDSGKYTFDLSDKSKIIFKKM
ncbi:MAG: hypothetical protein NTX63_00880 [Candidatus Peregrinibacteria bacterium]|nr:hypothetical protein [Candidatus Peregrinibacteria bacterium]